MKPKKQLWKVRERNRFLRFAMELLAGSSHISFEGDLSSTQLLSFDSASTDESPVLKRSTLWPRQDFVILPLEIESVPSILRALGGTIPRSIFHIQIEKDGRLELGA